MNLEAFDTVNGQLVCEPEGAATLGGADLNHRAGFGFPQQALIHRQIHRALVAVDPTIGVAHDAALHGFQHVDRK